LVLATILSQRYPEVKISNRSSTAKPRVCGAEQATGSRKDLSSFLERLRVWKEFSRGSLHRVPFAAAAARMAECGRTLKGDSALPA